VKRLLFKKKNFVKRLMFFQDPYSSGGGTFMANSSSKSLQVDASDSSDNIPIILYGIKALCH
jgi:hypothetical protein